MRRLTYLLSFSIVLALTPTACSHERINAPHKTRNAALGQCETIRQCDNG